MSARRNSERGAVLVMVALMLPLLLLLLVFAVDTGHWWTHERHLQTQADAAALAGALGPWLPGCNENSIEQNAWGYSGDLASWLNAGGTGTLYNQQYSNASNVRALINSADYWNNGGANFSDGGGTPCNSLLAGNGHLDLKLTESNLPNLFGGIPGFSSVTINAHARVDIESLQSASGSLPIGVPDQNPVDGAAIFVNESSGDPPSIIAISKLGKLTSPPNPVTLNGTSLTEWDTNTVTLPISRPNTGVVVAFTGNPSWSLTGSITDICGQTLVECFQGEDIGPYRGLSFIRGYDDSATGTPANPALGDVQINNGSCSDDSAPYFVLNGGCSVQVKAQISFGNATSINVSVDGPGLGCPNGNPAGCPMTLVNGYWTTQGRLPVVPSGAGPIPLTINWNDKGNKGSFSQVHRIYSADSDPAKSGPVEYIRLADPSNGSVENTVKYGTRNFVVRVGIQASLGTAQSVGDPIVKLRVIGGSRNQSLDCDPKLSNLSQELAAGCAPEYEPNTGQVCPASAPSLWGSSQPWHCVAVQTGSDTNQVPKGMNLRIFGDEKPNQCTDATSNHWGEISTTGLPVGDKRLLFVLLTPFGTFNGSGSGTVPVTGFAEFYVTGWTGQGQGFNNPCEGHGDDPVPGPAYIVGHFIRYVGDWPGSGAGPASCKANDPSILTPCIAVLTQ